MVNGSRSPFTKENFTNCHLPSFRRFGWTLTELGTFFRDHGELGRSGYGADTALGPLWTYIYLNSIEHQALNARLSVGIFLATCCLNCYLTLNAVLLSALFACYVPRCNPFWHISDIFLFVRIPEAAPTGPALPVPTSLKLLLTFSCSFCESIQDV